VADKFPCVNPVKFCRKVKAAEIQDERAVNMAKRAGYCNAKEQISPDTILIIKQGFIG
jgi:hypothetical protein